MQTKAIKISICVALLVLFLFVTERYEYQVHGDQIQESKCVNYFTRTRIPSNYFFNKRNNKNSYGNYNFQEHSLFLGGKTLFNLPPNYFKKASCVKSLKLNSNNFVNIPATLQDLEGLEILTMAHNKVVKLKGSLFSKNINLKELDLNSNEIKTIDLNGFPNLHILNLSGNNITNIKPIQQANIKKIILFNNELNDFPYELKGISNLNSLDLSYNSFDTISNNLTNDLSKFNALISIDLKGNQLTDFPTALGQMPKLEQIELKNNKISGELILSGFNALKDLSLQQQFINSFIIESNSLQNLNNIQFSGNEISEFEIKSTLINCSLLDLSTNEIKVIPPSITLLKNLEELNLSNNKLTEIPNLEELAQLKKLSLYSNNLTTLKDVKLPASLEELDLSNNFNLENFPISLLKDLPNLKKLDLSLSSIPSDQRLQIEGFAKMYNFDIQVVF